MPEQRSLAEVAALAAQLLPGDRRQLTETILRDLAAEPGAETPPRRPSWREIRGSVPYPLCGEDAQT